MARATSAGLGSNLWGLPQPSFRPRARHALARPTARDGWVDETERVLILLDQLTMTEFSALVLASVASHTPFQSFMRTPPVWALTVAVSILAWVIPLQARAASIVIDAGTGLVLASTEPTLRWPPASLTKLLTLYLTFAAVENGSLKLEQALTVSAHAAGQRGSRLGLTAADEITVQEAVLGVITQSGNDAAMVLAEAVGGNEAAFVAAMNERAKALGLEQSYFINPTGLPDARQTTSARDMALLAQALWRDFPQYYQFFGARRMRFGRHDLPTINAFLASYRGADGLKTGTTCDAGHNLVASAERDGRRLIGVVLGAPDAAARIASMAGLLDEGFSAAAEEHGLNIAALRPSLNEPRRSWQGAGACLTNNALPPPQRPPALPGWGVLLGAFSQEFRARRAIELVKSSLRLPADFGQPTIMPLKDVRYYGALLVGLNADRAMALCTTLRGSGAYCVRVAPGELNDPNARWRE
jgi:D-alanyl-D-alanine carboxypeptidase